jgi:hypothetical protein
MTKILIMKKLTNILIFGIILSVNLFSQGDPEDFQLSLPEQKVQGSLYDKLLVIDSRPDTSNMGIVQKGVLNRQAKVIPHVPIARQIENVFNAIIGSGSNNGELILQLKHFSFAEVTSVMSEKGYCYFRADLFAKNNDKYQVLSTIDTVILVKGMDVTKGLMKSGSRIVIGFITNNLLKKSDSREFLTFDNVYHIDDYEKRNIVLYQTNNYNEGIYFSYNTFKNQTPELAISEVEIQLKKNELVAVKKKINEGKLQKIKSKDIYAVIYKGQLFIATDAAYYRLYKMKNNFYFTGMLDVPANSADVLTASLFFGVIGGLLATMDQEGMFFIKVDHKNGDFIRLKKIKTYQ